MDLQLKQLPSTNEPKVERMDLTGFPNFADCALFRVFRDFRGSF